MKRVLLTNGLQRKSLVAARSLGRRGIDVIAAETTRCNPTAFSKYCRKSLVCPDPDKEPAAYCRWLEETIDRFSCDIVFPMDDNAMALMEKNRSRLEKRCLPALPPTECYRVASDKGLSVAAAGEAGLDCPQTIMVNDLQTLKDIAEGLSPPVVIKPRKSSGSRGIRIVTRKDDFVTAYHAVHGRYPYPLIQEYIPPGDKYDVCLLFDSAGRLKASFVQKEIRHFPVGIGPSTVQESVLCPGLVEKSLALMNRLKWRGIVELEFMFDRRDGRFKFMEINPRFWNSLYMAVLAGVDFPWLLYKTMTEEDFAPVAAYETGLMCRWLLPGDILHFLTSKDRWKMNPPFLAGKKQGVYDDIICADDPLPVLGFALACLRFLPDKDMWKNVFER